MCVIIGRSRSNHFGDAGPALLGWGLADPLEFYTLLSHVCYRTKFGKTVWAHVGVPKILGDTGASPLEMGHDEHASSPLVLPCQFRSFCV